MYFRIFPYSFSFSHSVKSISTQCSAAHWTHCVSFQCSSNSIVSIHQFYYFCVSFSRFLFFLHKIKIEKQTTFYRHAEIKRRQQEHFSPKQTRGPQPMAKIDFSNPQPQHVAAAMRLCQLSDSLSRPWALFWFCLSGFLGLRLSEGPKGDVQRKKTTILCWQMPKITKVLPKIA